MMRTCFGSGRHVVCILAATLALTACGDEHGISTPPTANAGNPLNPLNPSPSPVVPAPTPAPGVPAPSPVNPSPSPAPAPSPDPTPTPSVPPGAGNNAPTIAGTAPTTINAGENYSFQPQAHDRDADDTISFTIANKPAWATFDAATGSLSGKPEQTHVGTYAGIEIAATDGDAVTALPPFTITVNSPGAQGAMPTVTLSWEPPTHNEDGTPIASLKGYTIHYGTSPQSYSEKIPVENPGVTSFVVEQLEKGTYYFAMTATAGDGTESAFSEEVTATLN